MGASASCARVGDNGPFIALGPTLVLNQSGVDAVIANPYGINLAPEYFVSWGDISGGSVNPNAAVSAGTILRDLKRTVTVYGTNGLKLHIFRQVQLINGPSTEGVSGSSSDIDAFKCGWICVWGASGYCGPELIFG